MNTVDISWINLLLGYTMLIIPFSMMIYFNTKLLKPTIIAVIRMTIQLFLVGLYLKYLFKLDNEFVNILWVLVMIVIATITNVRKSKLRFKLFFFPISLAILASIIIVIPFFLKLTVQLDNMFTARYFIPIAGMTIGNCMERNIMALNSYYQSLTREQLEFRYYLANGATLKEATLPHIKNALNAAFNPLIAQMTVIGLVTLPGTMTGQILGGSSPDNAIKYQILLMLSIFIATMITVVLTLLFSNKLIFDENDGLRK